MLFRPKYNIRDLVAEMRVQQKLHEYTPDMAELELNHSALLFVCDHTQRGHHFNGQLAGPLDWRVNPAITIEPLAMFNKRDGADSYPITLRMEHAWTGHPKLNVRGELWTVPSTTIRNMDTFYRNGKPYDKDKGPVLFERVKIAVKVPIEKLATSNKGQMVIARGCKPELVWAYLGTKAWLEILDATYTKVGSYPWPAHWNLHRTTEQLYWWTTEEYKS